MTELAPGAARLLQRCDQLAAISERPGMVCRTYLSPAHHAANLLVGQWLREAGLTPWADAAGNIWGRLPAAAPDAPFVILGSHLDTVVNAGRYDGILGVLAAIEVADSLHRADVALAFNLDVVGFADEEGVRFGATLLGSRAVAGRWDPAWFELADADGISMAAAFSQFGLTPAAIASADRSREALLAYLELHIEQGPVLENYGQPLGIVTAIAGARRFKLAFEGMAGHAGTVPMPLRRDALIGAAEAILRVETIAKAAGIVATVGQISAAPGAVNVIAGRAELSLDVRAGDDAARDLAVQAILNECQVVASERGLGFSALQIHSAPAARCSSRLQRLMEATLQGAGLDPISLMSGAGHDAMAFADVCELGMLFLRCAGGVSHHPAEAVNEADVEVALRQFEALVRAL